jgi:hypothetical protein
MMWLTIHASRCIYAFLGSVLQNLMSAVEVKEEGIDVTHLEEIGSEVLIVFEIGIGFVFGWVCELG